MDPSFNIAQVARRFARSDWGGTETVVLETSRRLRARGHRNEIVCPRALADVGRETIEEVPVTRTPYFYPYWGLSPESRRALDLKGGNLFSFSLMRWLARRPGLDLIHAHTQKRLGGIVRHVARRRGIPYIVSLHGGCFDVPAEEARRWTTPTRGAVEWGKALGWWVGARRVLEDAEAVVCVGQREAELAQSRLPEQRVVHLPNGVDPCRFERGDGPRFRRQHGIPPSATLLTVVGRIDPQKNQKLAVDALDALAGRRPDLHLALVGHVTSDAYRDALHREICNRGLGGRVTLIPGLDTQSDALRDAYHAADVVLLPSTHEPFGIVVLEAWAAGRPVVASRVGGLTSLVDDGHDGLLVPPGDTAALVGAVERLVDDAPLRHRLAERGRDKARRNYSWDRITDQLLNLYLEVLDVHAHRN